MADLYSGTEPGVNGIGQYAAAVTPNDGADISNVARFLWVGGYGDVKVDTVNSSGVTFTGVQGYLWARIKRVYATGTTATNITAVW